MNDTLAPPQSMDLHDVRTLIKDDLEAVDRLIRQELQSDVVLINQLASYIINSGGKRLRPMVALLAARASGYQGDGHLRAAAIIEFIHTATLLHDDVVDASELRRGRDTANAIWGNEASVLVGDFLYSRSFQMMVSLDRMQIMGIMAQTTNAIAEGEVMQLLYCNDPDTTEQRYMDVINRKTAILFSAAARLGPVLTGGGDHQADALALYGQHLGTAFQLVDDILDYRGDSDEIGKNVGDDLAEGKPTLPMIYAMRTAAAAEREVLRNAIEQGGREHIEPVLAAVESTGAIDYTARLARQETDQAIAALSKLAESEFKTALIALAEFSVSRKF